MKLKKRKTYSWIYIYFFLLGICVYFFISLVDRQVTDIAYSVVKADTYQSINDYIFHTFSSSVITEQLDNLIAIDKNKKEEIIRVSYNVKDVYAYLGFALDTLYNQIADLSFSTIYYDTERNIYLFPTGLLMRKVLFSRMGMLIPCKVYLLTDTKMSLHTSVKSYGMNNSLMEIYLNITVENSFLGPLYEENFSHAFSVLLASSLIVGTVPNYFGGVIEQDSAIVTSENT